MGVNKMNKYKDIKFQNKIRKLTFKKVCDTIGVRPDNAMRGKISEEKLKAISTFYITEFLGYIRDYSRDSLVEIVFSKGDEKNRKADSL